MANVETLEIVYVWPDGREEVRYRRQLGTNDADRFMKEVDEIKARCDYFGEDCPYYYRFV